MKTLIKFFKQLTGKAVKFEKGKGIYSCVDADDGRAYRLAKKYGYGLE